MLRETLYYDKFNRACQTSRFINKPNYVENIASNFQLSHVRRGSSDFGDNVGANKVYKEVKANYWILQYLL